MTGKEIEQKHKKQVEELHRLENELIALVAATNDEALMNKLIEWQEKRNSCNETYSNWLNYLKTN